jgi:hypothetical protein
LFEYFELEEAIDVKDALLGFLVKDLLSFYL